MNCDLKLMEQHPKIRSKKLPNHKEIGNAGSFFKNPIIDLKIIEKLIRNYPDIPVFPLNGEKVKISAAWLIERCGFKGKRIKIDGYLEEFNLSKEEADNLIMNARKIVFAD